VDKARFEDGARRDTWILLYAVALLNIYFAYKVNVPGLGTVSAAVSAATVSHLWTVQGKETLKNQLSEDLAFIWDKVTAPCLYSMIGSSVNLDALINGNFLPPALACILIPLVPKAATILALQRGTGNTLKEGIFFAIGFMSKATVTATLAGQFLILAQTDAANAASDDGTVAAQLASAQIVQQVAVLSIVVCAISSGVAMKLLGRTLLMKDEDFDRQKISLRSNAV